MSGASGMFGIIKSLFEIGKDGESIIPVLTEAGRKTKGVQ